VHGLVRLGQASDRSDVTTFHQWVVNQFGEKLFSIFFKTYTEKVWGMSCDEISADWASQRIKGLDLAGHHRRPQALAGRQGQGFGKARPRP
jgi:protoporphyrinogen oxidase